MTQESISTMKSEDFNSHAHVERDRIEGENHTILPNFNSHAHVERDLFIPILPQMKKYFNSHAHVERDKPTFSSNSIYIHFNSHAHVERDWEIREILKLISISTHTLTWSVTDVNFVNLTSVAFQLTRSRGA